MTIKSIVFVLLGLVVPLSVLAAATDPFIQGPGRAGQVMLVRGTVIGQKDEMNRACYVILADRLDAPAARGLGGGGRFLLCNPPKSLGMGQEWSGRVRQEGTTRLRAGAYWRVSPVFVPN